MSAPDPSLPPDVAERIARLEAELAIARDAAEAAERAQGALAGELIEVRNEWAAANLNQQEWDRLLAEHLEELRLCRERLAEAEEARRAVVESTTWRLAQGALAPYRRVRAARG